MSPENWEKKTDRQTDRHTDLPDEFLVQIIYWTLGTIYIFTPTSPPPQLIIIKWEKKRRNHHHPLYCMHKIVNYWCNRIEFVMIIYSVAYTEQSCYIIFHKSIQYLYKLKSKISPFFHYHKSFTCSQLTTMT